MSAPFFIYLTQQNQLLWQNNNLTSNRLLLLKQEWLSSLSSLY